MLTTTRKKSLSWHKKTFHFTACNIKGTRGAAVLFFLHSSPKMHYSAGISFTTFVSHIWRDTNSIAAHTTQQSWKKQETNSQKITSFVYQRGILKVVLHFQAKDFSSSPR